MVKTHGEASIPQSLEYRSWAGMIQRCTNPNNTKFKDYGGKNITVCAQWLASYSEFLKDMGRRPTNAHTLERIDNKLGYSPDNCIWGTRKEQSRNRSNCKVTVEDVKKIKRLYQSGISQKSIAIMYKVTRSVIHKIVNNKTWSDVT